MPGSAGGKVHELGSGLPNAGMNEMGIDLELKNL